MIRQITPNDLALHLENGHTVVLLDVRQIWEHEQVALPNSVLIPLHELPQRTQELPTDKNTPIVVYCHHGMRSFQGAGFLQQLGYTQVQSLAGGIDAWSCQVDPTLPRYS